MLYHKTCLFFLSVSDKILQIITAMYRFHGQSQRLSRWTINYRLKLPVRMKPMPKLFDTCRLIKKNCFVQSSTKQIKFFWGRTQEAKGQIVSYRKTFYANLRIIHGDIRMSLR